jgi:peptidoglycan/LPS O-acetylase OafA/YrhL
MSQPLSKQQRVFGLDVLRAFAILMVMTLHSHPWVSTRFTWFHDFVRHYDGVTIFFCLSGFLIGGILIKTLENKGSHFSNLWDFWLRRWIRTVPPYLLILPIAMLLEVLHGFPAKTFPPYFVFMQNFNWPMPSAFIESWSLTVEEWFYLLSAPASFLLARLLKPRYGVLLAAVLFLISATAYRYQCFRHFQPATTYQWDEYFRKIVLLRLDSLMYGVVAAWIAHYYPMAWIKAKWPLFVLGFISLSVIFNGRCERSLHAAATEHLAAGQRACCLGSDTYQSDFI